MKWPHQYLAKMLWEAERIPLGPLAPWVLGLMLNRKPKRVEKCKED